MRTLFIFCISLSAFFYSFTLNAQQNFAYLYNVENVYRPVSQLYAVTQRPNRPQESPSLHFIAQFEGIKNEIFNYYYTKSLADSAYKSRIQSFVSDTNGLLKIPLDTAEVARNTWLVLIPTEDNKKIIPIWLAPAKKFGGSAAYALKRNNQQVFNYLASTDTASFVVIPQDTLYTFAYHVDFSPATTPMAAPNPGEMSISDRVATTRPDTLHFKQEGFYFTQTDTTGLAGYGFRVVSPYFPQTRRIKNFAGPIRYISTQEEWNELQRSDYSKEALDRFWFRMTQSQELAKKIIRQYYRNVANANTLFTGFKEGWKTDQGMIYMLYGAPPQVEILPNGDEKWKYPGKENIAPIEFVFKRSLNPFSEPYFQLIRNRNYARTHYQVINQWRRGVEVQ